jgi:hypothetical protein
MKLTRLLPLVLALLAGFAQYAVLNMFEAGRRQGIWVVASSFIFAAIAAYGTPLLTASKAWQFSDMPEIAVLFRPGGLQVAALTTLLAAGWLVGLAAFCGSLLAQVKKPPTTP